MQPFKRQMFICSAIEKCQEKVSCCPHKTAHIKDERCVPRECRYAPGAGSIDCDPFDPENPRAPVPVPVAPVKKVEQRMKEKQQPVGSIKVTIADEAGMITGDMIKELKVKGDTIKHDDSLIEESVTQEIDIKEAVKKQASSRPVNTIKGQKKGGSKKA